MKTEGKTLDCLREYLAQLPWKSKDSMQARQPIVDFVGVTGDTVARWFNGSVTPNGLSLVKVRYFLENQGYRILELGTLEEPVRNLGKLIAFGIIESEKVCKQMGFTETTKLFAVLHGNRGLSDERMTTVKQICADHKDDLGKLPTSKPMAQTAVMPVVKPAHAVPDTSTEVICLLNILDGLVTLLTPRLEYMLSNGFTAEKRQEFRQAVGDKLIFHLANRFYGLNQNLNALCSEKARELNSNKNQR